MAGSFRQLVTNLRRHHDEVEALKDLVRHCWVHSGYADCGYWQMTTEQKQLYCRIIGSTFDPETSKRT